MWLLWTRLLWKLGCSCPTSHCICIFRVSSRLYTCWSQGGSICNFLRGLHTVSRVAAPARSPAHSGRGLSEFYRTWSKSSPHFISCPLGSNSFSLSIFGEAGCWAPFQSDVSGDNRPQLEPGRRQRWAWGWALCLLHSLLQRLSIPQGATEPRPHPGGAHAQLASSVCTKRSLPLLGRPEEDVGTGPPW